MEKTFEIIGLLGATIVSISNIPQMVMFIRNKHAKGISISGNWVGFFGVVLRAIYLGHLTHWDAIALSPYGFSISCILLTFYYIYWPKKEEDYGINT